MIIMIQLSPYYKRSLGERIHSLYSKLRNLPKCGNKFLDIQRLEASVEKILK